MALTLDDLIASFLFRRTRFLKHVDGLQEDQWDWKPYPECKSVRETVAHLIVDDRAALQRRFLSRRAGGVHPHGYRSQVGLLL